MSSQFKSEKTRLLYSLTEFFGADPMFMFTIGLLTGHIERVHFVKDLTGAPIALKIASSRARIWPSSWFQAQVNNVAVPDPMTLGLVLAKNEEPICVELVVPGLFPSETTAHLLVEDYATVISGQDAETQSQEKRISTLRRQIDHALDVYNECLEQLAKPDVSEERRKELETFVKIAKTELSKCSREINNLEKDLDS